MLNVTFLKHFQLFVKIFVLLRSCCILRPWVKICWNKNKCFQRKKFKQWMSHPMWPAKDFYLAHEEQSLFFHPDCLIGTPFECVKFIFINPRITFFYLWARNHIWVVHPCPISIHSKLFPQVYVIKHWTDSVCLHLCSKKSWHQHYLQLLLLKKLS